LVSEIHALLLFYSLKFCVDKFFQNVIKIFYFLKLLQPIGEKYKPDNITRQQMILQKTENGSEIK
jgi:hypothetical protein